MSGERRPRTTKPVGAILLLLLLSAATSTAKYSGGSGEPNDPYRIATPNDLNDIGNHPNDWHEYFVMTNDINMAAYTGTQFKVIGTGPGNSFTGRFDGNGHVISNLTIDTAGAGRDYIGLFGRSIGTIKNLGVKDVNIAGGNGSDYVGAICGENHHGLIRNCWASGTVSTGNDSEYLGGLCGENYEGIIRWSWAAASVSAGNNCFYIGGLCGADEGSLEYCHASGPVSGGVGSLFVGGLCGVNFVIRNCYATGPVYCDSNSIYIGGLCGEAYFIQTSCSTGTVTGQNSGVLGGLCGATTAGGHGGGAGTIIDCYATGSVNGRAELGGLIGRHLGSATNSYATGHVSGANSVGGLCGHVGEYGHIEYSYFLDPNDGGGPDNGYGTPLTDEQMKQQSTFAAWDFIGEPTDGTEGKWEMPPEEGYPILSSQDPYSGGDGSPENPFQMATAGDIEQLSATFMDWEENFILVDDINAAGYVYARAPIGFHYYDDSGWGQILVEIPFSGVFDGNNHKISNLTIEPNEPFEDWVGLFGYVKTGLIEDLGLENENIDVNVGEYAWCIGGLAGVISDQSIITNCYSSGDVRVGDQWASSIGGLVGDINDSTMVNCYSNCSVSAGEQSSYVGGLVGFCRGKVSHCRAFGSVSGRDQIGGLCGYNYSGTISNSHSTAFVSGDGLIGGLCGANGDSVGQFSATISNCYAIAIVSGDWAGGLSGDNSFGTIDNSCALGVVSGSSAIGGLCGAHTAGRIVNCYAAASVFGDSDIAGLVGNDYDGVYANCFWDADVNPDINGIGNADDPNVIGRTTPEMMMQTTFTDAGWDFVGEVANGTEDIWRMCWDGGWYPRLAWQFHQWADFVCPDRVDFKDFSYLAARLGRANCADSNNCDGADLDYSGIVDSNDVRILTALWLKGRAAPGELAVPPGVDFADYAKLTSRWLNQECWLEHNCYGTDLDFSGVIDWRDLKVLADHWLQAL
ncbi:MAG: GLUG motif-containing protein [Planctomycetota bacterium]|jgi:hypothetical protein